MRNLVVILTVVIFAFMASGCGDTMTYKGVEYDTYGLLNSGDMKNPNLEYQVIWGNLFWGCFLFATVIAPVYFFGFSLFEPVGIKGDFEVGEVR